MPAIKTIGVLTSGGDCAGLNAAIRAVTAAALGAGAGRSWVFATAISASWLTRPRRWR